MTAEARVDDELLAVAWFAEFDEEYALVVGQQTRREVQVATRTEDKSYMLIARKETRVVVSSWAMTWTDQSRYAKCSVLSYLDVQ